ncbi:hypothetical protein LTR95_001816 [Oleoguttula sp. CCFEE 5521]
MALMQESGSHAGQIRLSSRAGSGSRMSASHSSSGCELSLLPLLDTSTDAAPEAETSGPTSEPRRPSHRRRSSVVPTEKLKVMGPYNCDQEALIDSDDDEASVASAQAGVKRLEVIASTWSKSSLYVAYFGICMLAYATSLEGQTTVNLTIYATSAFSAHSLVATVMVVQGVVLSVVKPPMSKLADVFGRFEAFTLSVFIFSIGYIQQAASHNVETYAAAQIFYAAGSTGLQILIQIFVADTSDLVNRALCSTLPAMPFLINVWVGAPLAETLLRKASWRWGYGIWAVILPVAYLPLALALYINQRKAAKKGILPPSPLQGRGYWQAIKHLWFELDVFGLVLICAGFSLLLIPLSLISDGGWNNHGLLAMLAIGAVCLAVFPFWERSKTFAPRAFFPGSLFKKRTVLAGFAISFFYFMTYYLSVYPYFQSYLLVVQSQSIASAGQIVQMWTFAATITSILVSLAIKYTKHYKYFITAGACINLLGLILMQIFRVEGASVAVLAGTTALVGIGGGMLNVPAQLGVQASASHQEVAAATAIFLTFLEVGGATGSAISGAIWSANVPRKLAQYLPAETQDQAVAIYKNITLASSGWEIGDPTRVAINRAYQETMSKTLWVAICVAIPVILLSFLMENYKLDEIEQHVTGVVIGVDADTAPKSRSASHGASLPRRVSTDSALGESEPMLSPERSAQVRRGSKDS